MAPGTFSDSTYSFVTIDGIVKLVSKTQPCGGCGSGLSQTRTYDSNGDLDKETDFRGVVTDFDYSARGLIDRRIDAKTVPGVSGTPVQQRTTNTIWHANFRVPTERRVTNAAGVDESLTRFAYNTRGQSIARCDVDPAIPSAVAYACGNTVNAPLGVRQTRSTICDVENLAAPDPIGGTENLAKGCPLIGLTRRVDGARTDVNDWTTFEYRLADDPTCASNGACAWRKGDLWKTINALGQVSEIASYDKAGRVTRSKDTNAVLTDFEYHPRGWMSKRIVRANASGVPDTLLDAVTQIDYDPTGSVIRVTQPDGTYFSYTYDDAQRLTRVADTTGAYVQYQLDAAGNRKVEKTSDISGALTRRMAREFDVLSRLSKERDALTATGAPLSGADVDDNTKGRITTDVPASGGYDGNGNRTASFDGLGVRGEQEYDPLNRLVKTLQDVGSSVPATANTTTRYTYDARDNLRTVVDPKGLTTSYTYDGLNNLTQLGSPDTGNTVYGYDAAGNRLTQTDARSVTANYGYDALNRLRTITYPTATLNTTFEYDVANTSCAAAETFGAGRLTRIVDSSGETRMCYDQRGNLRRKLQTVNAVVLTTAWTYDRADRMESITYPSGISYNIQRDSQGRVLAISNKNATVVRNASYLPMGPLTQIMLGDETTLDKRYDTNYRIDAVESSQAAGLKIDFSTDVMGNIVSASDAIGGAPRNSFEYDRLYRLTAVRNTNNALIEAYAYDATGNRLSKQVGPAAAVPYSYPAANHRLTSIGGVSRSYDANGNTTVMPVAGGLTPTLSYSDNNRLTGVNAGAGLSAQYEHNGRGERVRKTVAGVTLLFAYDSAGRLLGEYDSTGQMRAEFVWLDDTPVAVQMGPAYGDLLRFLETDHLNTPRRVIDEKGDLRYDWPFFDNAFGERAATSLDVPCVGNCLPGSMTGYALNLRFPGQYFDSETGLAYNYFRDYEAGVGRYVESDPIGLRGGISSYAYVDSRVLHFVDRLGLYPEMCHRPVQGPIPGRHCYVQFNGDTNDTLSFDPSGVGPDPSPTGAVCTAAPSGNDDCVKTAMKQCESSDYNFTGFNCCHCVEDAFKKCRVQIAPDRWPNWPINPGAQPWEPGYDPDGRYGPTPPRGQ